MKKPLKEILRIAIKECCIQIIEQQEYDKEAIWWPDELVNRMTDAAALIYDQNKETQTFVKKERYMINT